MNKKIINIVVVVTLFTLVILAFINHQGLINFIFGQDLGYEVKAQIGDSYGSFNALFSSLALVGLIISIYFQRQDLKAQHDQIKLNNQELVDTRKEIENSNKEFQINRLTNVMYNQLNQINNIILENKVKVNSNTNYDGWYSIEHFNRASIQYNKQLIELKNGVRSTSNAQSIVNSCIDLYTKNDIIIHRLLTTLKACNELLNASELGQREKESIFKIITSNIPIKLMEYLNNLKLLSDYDYIGFYTDYNLPGEMLKKIANFKNKKHNLIINNILSILSD